MNETAQETAAVMALLVEQVPEIMFTSLPEHAYVSTYINYQHITQNLARVHVGGQKYTVKMGKTSLANFSHHFLIS